MRYLKQYEKSKKDIPNFKEGDYVFCINNENSILTQEIPYLVKKIFKNKDNCYVCKISSKLGLIGEKLGTFSCDRFVTEETYKEMIFQNDIKNFNL